VRIEALKDKLSDGECDNIILRKIDKMNKQLEIPFSRGILISKIKKNIKKHNKYHPPGVLQKLFYLHKTQCFLGMRGPPDYKFGKYLRNFKTFYNPIPFEKIPKISLHTPLLETT